MTWISTGITSFGLLLLVHACYSAQEHSALQSFRATALLSPNPSQPSGSTLSSPSGGLASGPSSTALPIDITIETLAATLIVCLGLVLGTPALRPIKWREWAGKIEREGEDGFRGEAGDVDRDFVGNPFKYLETRPGFVDIRKQRKEFTQWATKGGGI